MVVWTLDTPAAAAAGVAPELDRLDGGTSTGRAPSTSSGSACSEVRAGANIAAWLLSVGPGIVSLRQGYFLPV